MDTATKTPVSIYTEMTPNPETMKFVADRMLFGNSSVDFADIDSAKESPLAIELFGFPFVKGVFIMNNFVTLTKTAETDWYEVIPSLKEFVKNYLEESRPIFNEGFKVSNGNVAAMDDDAVVAKVKEMLENYVKPAVEMDGGAIQFKSFEKGVVKLMLQGSCSGCPSSIVTLKSGIEGLLKRMVPEVTEVVAENE